MEQFSQRSPLTLGLLLKPFCGDDPAITLGSLLTNTFRPKGHDFPSDAFETLLKLHHAVTECGLTPESLEKIPLNRNPVHFISTFLTLWNGGILQKLSRTSLERYLMVTAESRFLRRFLLNHASSLTNAFFSAFDANDVTAELTGAARENDPEELWQALQFTKYRSMCQILASDLSGEATLAQTTHHLSDLADCICQRTFNGLLDQGRTTTIGSAAVIAMGKLGAQELNYASDIDIVYVALATDNTPPVTEPLTRLLERFGSFLSKEKDGSFLHRVDVGLRPFGTRAPLVVSQDALLRYLERQASQWEKHAYLKGRVMIGPPSSSQALLEAIQDRIWTKYLDFRTIDHMKEIKLKIDYETTKHPFDETSLRGWNVKLGRGGIREIEFFVQTLQMIYGGKTTRLRIPGTLNAIRELAHTKVLDEEKAAILTESYETFRHLEHHLQLFDERQVYEIPREPIAYQNCIDCFRFPADGILALRKRVVGIFQDLFSKEEPSPFRALRYEIEKSTSHAALTHALAHHPNPEIRSHGLTPASYETLKALFSPLSLEDFPLAARTALLPLVEMALKPLLESIHPDRAIHTFNLFVRNIKGKVVFYRMLLHNSILIEQLAKLFSLSPLLSDLLLKSPDGLDAILLKRRMDTDTYHREALETLQSQVALPRVDMETVLDHLRVFKKNEFLRIGFNQVIDSMDIGTLYQELTWVADTCIHHVHALATGPQGHEEDNPTTLTVFGLGRLGARRLHFASDLDLLFLYDAPSETEKAPEMQQTVTKRVQKIISALSLMTKEGKLYEIDPRLRPSGNQGVLVSSTSAFSDFLGKHLESWQRLAFFKLRPIAGPAALGDRIMALVKGSLSLDPQTRLSTYKEINELIAKLRAEWQRSPKGFDIKLCNGGLLEIELLVQTLSLFFTSTPASYSDILSLIDQCTIENVLDTKDAAFLRESYVLFDRIASYLPLFSEHSSSYLKHDERSPFLAKQLGFTNIQELTEELNARRSGVEALVKKQFSHGDHTP